MHIYLWTVLSGILNNSTLSEYFTFSAALYSTSSDGNTSLLFFY